VKKAAQAAAKIQIVRAAIYARVSTKDKGQDVENQLAQLRRYAAAQQWEMIEYVDHESGKHAEREQFKAMFAGASRREFGVVLVWALDRLTREGVYETFAHIRRLRDYGVQFESFTEAHFRTTGPAGDLMLAIAAWIAQQERIRISERTKAGIERARREGRIGGRRARVFDRVKAQKLRDSGLSWREIGRKMNLAQSTIRDALKRLK
jgi:DNA invertase Pin-like site-specific DNA recombinase